MKCQHCKKRDATVHLTEIKNNVKQEMHLCEACAAEKGLPGKAHFSISELLAGIASAAQAQKTRRGKEPRCPTCDLTLSQFQASGRFGCADCYTAFKDELASLIEKIHDAQQHVGKTPRGVPAAVGLQKEIRALQIELKKVVQQEEYKQAASLRDRIKALEEQLRGLSGGAPASAEPGAGSAGGPSLAGPG